MNVGQQTIDWLYTTQLQVDDEWALRGPDGFTWWAAQNAQTIEIVAEEQIPDGTTGYVISVRTQMVDGLDLTDAAAAAINAGPMRTAALAGPVYDAEARRLSLCSMAMVHADNADWMRVVLSSAAAMQLTEAMLLGPGLAEQLGAEPALTAHPSSGTRERPDEVIGAVRLFLTEGSKPLQWEASEFEETFKQYANQAPALESSAGDDCLTVEFPHGEGSSLCQIIGDQPHPLYGNGLLVLQRFPFSAGSPENGARLALALNADDLATRPAGYGFGSFAYVDNMICFGGFMPNALHRQMNLGNLYFSCATRARAVSKRLLDRDWDANSFTFEHTALGHIMREAGEE